jgi:hypothetical protein
MAQAILEYLPPLIRESAIGDSAFRQEFGFKTRALIALGNTGLSVERGVLFDAVRKVLTEPSEVELTDTDGKKWLLREHVGNEGQRQLTLSSDDQEQTLPDFRVLARDSAIRIQSLEESTSDVNLPIRESNQWREILAVRGLEDHEVDPFHKDIRDTPVHIERSIYGEILAGQSSVSSLVPPSRRYYERLVGTYDGSTTINDYAAGAGREFLNHLSSWRPYEGLLFSLFLSAHSALTAGISVDDLDSESLARAYGFVEKYGDTLSRLGAIEVAFRILADRPEVSPYLLPLVCRIRDDDVESASSEFKLFSSLFVLVDGEISRLRLMADVPPFYRRLASLAQAAVIQRQLMRLEVDYTDTSEWAFGVRAEEFYVQSLADMRIEPRWNPEMAAAPQMKADFFGRIMIAASHFKEKIQSDELRGVVLGDEPTSLAALSEFPYPYFPGPLEGGEDSPNNVPEDIAQAIEQQLDADEVGPKSFFALVNSALVFKVPAGHAEMAATALRLGNHRLASIENRSQLLGILGGLATVAAVARNTDLAGELRILVRRYRQDLQFRLSIEEGMRISLVAAASRENLMEWCEYVGESLTEFSFSTQEVAEGLALKSYLHALFPVVPELWCTCARADAALTAYCDS